MKTVSEGKLLWEPSEELKDQSNMRQYMTWLRKQYDVETTDYFDLWEWSVGNLESFWSSIGEYFEVPYDATSSDVLPDPSMPGPTWFPEARLNYVRHVFERGRREGTALISRSENRPYQTVPWSSLEDRVASVSASLRQMGVEKGDRVVAYISNLPEAVVAFLATASLGAVWSSCSPDFGTRGVVDRFAQIEPKVLFATDGYRYNGTAYDRREEVENIREALPGLEKTVWIPYLNESPPSSGEHSLAWGELMGNDAELEPESVEFEHPLWVLFSSGTTGPPKPIVQGHGGILLEHLKMLSLHHDLDPGDRFFWLSTTGWMMWNYLVGGLLVGAVPVLYEGSATHPDPGVLWSLAEQAQINLFGTSAPYLNMCRDRGLDPGDTYDLSSLRSIGSTGAPLSPEGFQWAHEAVKEDLWVASVSGGTDLCTAFLGGSPLLPVHAGELQCACLGARAEIFDEQGNSIVDQPGELVLTEPMPSMPLFFWNDPGDQRYRESYFETYPGVWRHGDWAKMTSRRSFVIYGRSDATINRRGVRMGTAELYRALEGMDEIEDTLAVHLEAGKNDSYLPLFVVPSENRRLDDELKKRIKERIRNFLTPRHVPDDVIEIEQIPRTLSGKKMELPVEKILEGVSMDEAANPDSMQNPDSLDQFVKLRGRGRIPG